MEYNLFDRCAEEEIIPWCARNGVLLIAYSPLDQGLLTGKYSPENPPSGLRGRTVSHRRLAESEALVSVMRRIGEGYGGKSPAQVALNWIMCKGAVPIPGAKNGSQARENAGSMGWRLSDESVEELDAASARAER